MTRTAWFAILGLMLHGCGAESDDSSPMVEAGSDESEWLEDEDETVEIGSFSVSLPEEQGPDSASCSINLTRAVGKRLANVILTLDVIGKGCDGMGNCSNPNMQSGVLNFSGGIDGDKPFATMILNYEPPSDDDETPMWMYNVIYNSAPFGRFDMKVENEAFNVLTSDWRDADDFSKGPHVWNTKIELEADMLQADIAENQSSPGLQTRGEFSYEGPCEIYGKYIQL